MWDAIKSGLKFVAPGISWLGEMGVNAFNYFNQRNNMDKQYKASIYNTDATIKANKELAEYQFLKNQDMWHMQNAYNSPEAQMQRYRQAGLNPKLMLQNPNPGNAVNIPSYQAPRVDYNYGAKQTPNLGSYLDLVMKQTQTALLNAQAQQTAENTRGINLENYKKQLENKLFEGKLPYELSVSEQNALKSRLQTEIEQINLDMAKYGVQGAESKYRILFQTLRQSKVSDDTIKTVLMGTTITEELVKVLGAMGLGFLLKGINLGGIKKNKIGFID